MADVVGIFAPDTSEAGTPIVYVERSFLVGEGGPRVSQLVVLDYLLQGFLVGVPAVWRERLFAGIGASPLSACVEPSIRGYRWKDERSRAAFWRRCVREGGCYDGPRVYSVGTSRPALRDG